MFSKAKRFEVIAPTKTQIKGQKKTENSTSEKVVKLHPTPVSVPLKTKKGTKNQLDTQSQCSSVPSVKSFATPKPVKTLTKLCNSIKKTPLSNTKININKQDHKLQDEVLKAQEVEIRNKDHTIKEYNKQIEDLKTEIACLQKLAKLNINEECQSNLVLNNSPKKLQTKNDVAELKKTISELEKQCEKLEEEVSNKQVELNCIEEIITVRDSLCKDLQEKLTSTEACLEETRNRLEMVKGHHALALEANESIRREYKLELETLKCKMDEEKQLIISKNKSDQENLKLKYDEIIETIKTQMLKERDDVIQELQNQLDTKDREFKAKFDQINEATHEKLRLCEIQFEERTQSIQEHWSQQQNKIKYLENETKDLTYSIKLAEEQNNQLQKEMSNLKKENEKIVSEKHNVEKEIEELKEQSKQRLIDFENEINKLTAECDKAAKEKSRFEMSLSVTRDIVQVLTMRLRESDSEVDNLESTVETLTNSKEVLETELANYKTTLNKTIMECSEYKEALVNILKSKAALAKEHTRIMEHNASLVESLQNVEKEAYRELGSIKNELIEDVELIKKESNSQIQMLREEVEKKKMLCSLATEHAGQATAAAEQSRVLLAQAAAEIARIEAENERYRQQIEDQQSLVVELSLLRQENEELAMTVAKQSSIIDKMKKEVEISQIKPKSPSVIRKTHKIGKENLQTVISPLRERNH